MSTDKTQRRRTGSVIASIVIGVLAAGLFAIGGALLIAHSKKDERGYLSTSGHPFSASGYAIAAEDLDIDLDGVGSVLSHDRYGKVRIAATPKQGKPVFVGVARSTDVSAYLAGAEYSAVTDVSGSPFDPTYETHAGNARLADPAAQSFWVESAHGSGLQAITWDVEDGDWSVVVMNEDASPGVAASVSAGASLPFLRPLAFGLLGGGLLLAIAAGLVAGSGWLRRRFGDSPR